MVAQMANVSGILLLSKNLENPAKNSGNVFSYTIGGLKASEKENSVLCLYRIGEAVPRPEIRERAKVRENILHWP